MHLVRVFSLHFNLKLEAAYFMQITYGIREAGWMLP